MKKSLIPIVSLLFIISLDSCKKDSDSQPEQQQPVGDTTRMVKTIANYSGSSTPETTYYEYDKSGRIVSVKDSADPSYYYTISYSGDEVIIEQAPAEPGNFNFKGRYKLNSNRLPVQRISVEYIDEMTATYPTYQVSTDTVNYEYDAAGLLVKATGNHFDTTWRTSSVAASRKPYTISYTNQNGKLMAIKLTAVEKYGYTNIAGGGSPQKITTNIEENYTFEYNQNYPNKVDSINAWLSFEMGLLYSDYAPTIKYGYLYDKSTHTEKRTDVASGNVYNDTYDPHTRTIEYFPSGYVSAVTDNYRTDWDKTFFTYNKQ
jgi:YD repeat-containing protein